MNGQNSDFENDRNEYTNTNGNGNDSTGKAQGYSYVFSDGGAGNAQENKGGQPPKKKGGKVFRVALIAAVLLLGALLGGAGVAAMAVVKDLLPMIRIELPGGFQTEAEDTTDTEEASESTTVPNVLAESPEDILEKTDPNESVFGSAGEDVFEISEVVRQVHDAVVVINATVIGNDMFGQSIEQQSAGSGVVVSEQGYILTCYHVVDGASSVKVSLNSGKEYDAILVGGDEASDLAVLKIDPGEDLLVYVEQGCSGDLVVGERVVAIGNPLGTLGGTVTTGIISATERNIAMSDGNVMTLIQTDAAINSGNSGGGLFNLDGQLVGIVNAKYSASGVEGLAFAIPIDSAYTVQLDLIKYGYVRGVIDHGLTLLEVTEATLKHYNYYYGLPEAGVYVVDSEYTDKLQNSDLIVSVNGTSIKTMADLELLLVEAKVGDVLTIVASREREALAWQTPEWESFTVELELREYIPDRLKDGIS